MADGILNLNKPSGPTSHSIVSQVRKLTGVRRAGHAGALDPMATGVLLICLGKATRVAEYLVDSRKSYLARVRLGVATDTYDADGEIVAQAPIDVDRRQLEAALEAFRGTISQVPPMYSAVKRQGAPLYRLARRGIEVPRPPRPVTIYRLELRDWDIPDLVLEISCSRGTYVRALAHDLGQNLGCGAHLSALVRTGSGQFRVENAVTIEAFAAAVSEGRWQSYLHPVDAALVRFPDIQLGHEEARRLCLGQTVRLPEASHRPSDGPYFRAPRGTASEASDAVAPPTRDGQLACARDPDGQLLAIVTVDDAAKVLRPHKVLCTPPP